MNKFITVFVALFAIGNAATTLRVVDPLVTPSVHRYWPEFSKTIIPSVAPTTVLRSYVPSTYAASYLPAEHALYRAFDPFVSADDLTDWETYKAKFGKSYVGFEDRMRRGVYFATKAKIAKYDELLHFGLGTEKLELNIFADNLRDELFSLRSITEEFQDEWDSYKVKNLNY